jgi:spore coat protein U-like protein
LLALALVAALLLVPARPASAAVTCGASMTSVTFGNVNPLGGSVDVSANIHWTCTHSGSLGFLLGVFGKMCLSIGTGSGGSMNPRKMLNGTHAMQFQLYLDAGRSQVWGGIDNPPYPPYALSFNFPILSGAQASGNVTVYARVPSGQSSLYVGTYANVFSGTHTQLDYRYNEVLLGLGTYPASCTSGGTAGTGTFSFTASANVQPSCTVSASDHDFGNVGGFLDASHDGTSAISLRCTNGAAWQVGLDNGQHASETTRRMSGAGGLVTYELYRDNARNQRWGNTEGSDRVLGTGTGTTQNLTVYGRVPAQAARPAGLYTDVVTVSVTY